MICAAKRDHLGYRCAKCGASWVGRTEPPPCLYAAYEKAVDDYLYRSEQPGGDPGALARAFEEGKKR